jgi:hypothetical protein
MIDLQELRCLLKLPIDDIEFDDSNPLDIKLKFRNEYVGVILNPELNSSLKNLVINTNRINWGPIFNYYQEDIQNCLPRVEFDFIMSPLKYKSVLIREKKGNHEEIYNVEYEHPTWILIK